MREARSSGPEDPIAEQAIAWFARVQSDRRTSADEDRFGHWLQQDPRHRAAYAQVEKLWRAAGPQITPRPLSASPPGEAAESLREPRAGPRMRMSRVLAAAAALTAITVGIAIFLQHRGLVSAGSYATATGVQQTLELSDGSSVTLNTQSEISVDIGKAARTVQLIRGEARFNVARDATRPFVVATGNARIRALGTAFDVRVLPDRIAVTLLEGRVAVATAPAAGIAKAAAPTILAPGQQLAVEANGDQQLRQVDLDRANAWVHRQLIFDAVPLPEAVAEANRYLQKPITVEGAALAQIKVSGAVRAGSLESFIGSLESAFPVRSVEGPNGPVLVARQH